MSTILTALGLVAVVGLLCLIFGVPWRQAALTLAISTVLAVSCDPARAEVRDGQLTVGAHLVSAHSRGGYEWRTPGLYVRLPGGFTAGAYRNSEARGTVYAGWTFETADRHLALTLGAATGYSTAPVVPLAVPSVRIGLAGGFSARLAYLPKPPTYRGAHALHLALEKAF